MTQDSFEKACDRLSQIVDATQFERLRWARREGPMLTRLTELTQAAVAQRPDFELTDEGSRNDTRRYVVKIHGTRVIALKLTLAVPRVTVEAEPIERSRYHLAPGEPVTADYDAVDEAWIAGAFDTLFARVQVAAA